MFSGSERIQSQIKKKKKRTQENILMFQQNSFNQRISVTPTKNRYNFYFENKAQTDSKF